MKLIQITNKKKEIVGYAKCDDEDYETLNVYKWGFTSRGYVCTMKKKSNNWRDGYKAIYMHRMIMNCPENMQVDHINHEVTDNRKENLRNVTASENSYNRRNFAEIPIKIRKKGTGIPYRTRLINGKRIQVTFY